MTPELVFETGMLDLLLTIEVYLLSKSSVYNVFDEYFLNKKFVF